MKPPRFVVLGLLVSVTNALLAAPLNAGLDASKSDLQVRAQDNLFLAVNGDWLRRTEIPADKSAYGTFIQLRDESDQRVRSLVEALGTQPQGAGSIGQKIRDYYTSYLNTDRIDALGLKPIQPLLTSIDAIHTRTDLARWLGRAQGHLDTPINLWVGPDAKQPNLHRASTWQGGLGLPDRDYYLKQDDARIAQARHAYESYLTTLAVVAGERQPLEAARRVLALEQRIAACHWSKVDNRDPVKTYNLITPAALLQTAPGFDWQAFLKGAQLGRIDQLSVSQPSTATGVAQLVADLPLADWKLYLKLHTLDHAAPVLPKPLREARFAFYGTALTGALQERPRWQQGIDSLNQVLGEGVGQLYVARYFPPDHKARMQELVSNLMAAYRESIDTLSWMTPTTKAKAQEKLSKYTVKIAYPEHWRDYSQLIVHAGDALGNQLRGERFLWARIARRVGKRVDRTEWDTTPQTVNAFYQPSRNEIVFPAGILQPPFFDMAADDAVNYGGIGAVIGHEISHGFDDQGSQFDGDGALRDWWTPADREAFNALTSRLVTQYEAYSPIEGAHINGRLTLGENIADLSGLQIAFKAYRRSLKGQPAPIIDGKTGEQRFFYGWAQSWRSKVREQRALQLLTTDPHAPGEFRANGAAINHDGFHQAFGTQPGDQMFKPIDQRIRLW